jgi:hypothetical protein
MLRRHAVAGVTMTNVLIGIFLPEGAPWVVEDVLNHAENASGGTVTTACTDAGRAT